MNSKANALAPGFLIASPPLGDPNFDRTVVLLAVHGESGALGFVVNRAAPMTLGELLAFAGYGDQVKDPTPVYLGGPVQPSSGWILYLDAEAAEAPAEDGAIIAVGSRMRVTSSRTAFDALAQDAASGATKDDPKRRMVVLGYSGWGPGQLEREIGAGAWLPVPLDERIVFDVALESRWEQAYGLLGLKPADVMSMRSIGEA